MLLLNILPKEISGALKVERRTIANEFTAVSILFADVVGFTQIAAKITPMQLVDLLDQVFLCFDELVERYDLEKIKTIGDCYMAASGVPRSRSDHQIRLKWDDLGGAEQSKLLVTAPETVIAEILNAKVEVPVQAKRPGRRPARGRSGSRRMEGYRS